jgi:hypothetical protein
MGRLYRPRPRRAPRREGLADPLDRGPHGARDGRREALAQALGVLRLAADEQDPRGQAAHALGERQHLVRVGQVHVRHAGRRAHLGLDEEERPGRGVALHGVHDDEPVAPAHELLQQGDPSDAGLDDLDPAGRGPRRSATA